jgi:glycine/D-amino acid oxidase-like deaminating enzyme
MPAESTEIIILGGGIIGLSTAYYLLTSSPKPRVTLIEPHRVAHGASSRAMGMVAETWHDREVLPLARLSWRCYLELVEQFSGIDEFDWRLSKVTGADIGQPQSKRSAYRKIPVGKQTSEQGGLVLNGTKYDMTGHGGVAAV